MTNKLIKIYPFVKSEGETKGLQGWATAEAIIRMQATKLAGQYMLVEAWELDGDGCLALAQNRSNETLLDVSQPR